MNEGNESSRRDLHRAAILELNPPYEGSPESGRRCDCTHARQMRALLAKRKEMDDALSTLHRRKKIDS